MLGKSPMIAQVGLFAFLIVISLITFSFENAYAPTGKIIICHIPPGNPENRHTIEVSASAVKAHLAHGDFLGSCETPPCDDGNSCTTNDVTRSGICVGEPVADGTSCTDANACNGSEVCQAGTCNAGTPPVVDDGNACTADSCDPITGVAHTPVPDGTSCGSGLVCQPGALCEPIRDTEPIPPD